MAEITPSRILTELDEILGILNGTSGGLPPIRTVESYNEITSGQSTMPRGMAQSSAQVTSTGLLRLTYFSAIKSFTVASLVVVSGGTAAAATPTLVRLGLYSVASDGAGTLIGSTPNDTTMLANINTRYTKALSAPVAVTRAARYAVGLLVVTGATAPTVFGGGTDSATMLIAPRLTGAVAGQTDLPASFTNAGAGASGSRHYFELLP